MRSLLYIPQSLLLRFQLLCCYCSWLLSWLVLIPSVNLIQIWLQSFLTLKSSKITRSKLVLSHFILRDLVLYRVAVIPPCFLCYNDNLCLLSLPYLWDIISWLDWESSMNLTVLITHGWLTHISKMWSQLHFYLFLLLQYY